MKHRNSPIATALAFLFAMTVPAFSQSTELSVEQMTANFENQLTRGLVIATPDSGVTDDATEVSGDVPAILATTPVIIPRENQVNVNVSFDFDSAALREDQKPKLQVLCIALKSADVQKVRILGHTDSSGSASYNERLSKLRAEEVKRFLTSDCGFPADRMEAQGVGERFPFDPENPSADVNRRVEFQAIG